MSPEARRFFGCLLPLILTAGICASCGLVAYSSQIFLLLEEVETRAMDGTLPPGEEVVVNNMAFWASDPVRGEVVLIGSPVGRTYRRVIAIPGDTIQVKEGTPRVNGVTLREPYASGEGENRSPVTLGAGEYFVLADNRDFEDSRQWGPLSREQIFGSVEFLRGDTIDTMAPVQTFDLTSQIEVDS